MDTKIVKIREDNLDCKELRLAAKCLREGGLVAFPTETVYGLGGNGLDEPSAARIYEAKGRPSDNPLIVHIAEISDVYQLAKEVSPNAQKLMEAFWPGPMTLIMKKKDIVPRGTTGGLDTVAIRMPVHPVALELIRESHVYVAAPSANLSGRPSPTCAEHVINDLSGRIDMIVDGGPVGIGLESTIVDVTKKIPMILRPGYITQEMLEQVVGEVRMDPGILSGQTMENVIAKAPGMKYKHYAPKGDMVLVEGCQENVVEYINNKIRELESQGRKCAVFATSESKNQYQAENVFAIGSRNDKESVAKNLYGLLRKMDDLGIEDIYSESFPKEALGQAIMNRMEKAAAHRIVQV